MTPSPRTPPPDAAAGLDERVEGAVILASWTLDAVLRRYPQLLDVLVELCPAFIKLRNPVLRRVQTRLVTVAQAAQIGGLEPAALVRTLNGAIGVTAAATVSEEVAEVAPVAAGMPLVQAPVAAALDVRPMLARGEEPFRAIMAAAAMVPVGQSLRLRAGFEPLPLYDLLADRGFCHQSRQLGPDDWEVVFLRDAQHGKTRPATSRSPAPGARLPVSRPDAPESLSANVRIDVSDLAPPEPMVRILEALAQLPAGQTLLVEHVRRPVYLYPQLDALGYEYVTRELGPLRVELRIHKPLPPANEVRQ